MNRFTLENQPAELVPHRKKTRVFMAFVGEPFEVITQEGLMLISPYTVDDWEDGYFVAYPDDGSKPYSISPRFVRDNYTPE